MVKTARAYSDLTFAFLLIQLLKCGEKIVPFVVPIVDTASTVDGTWMRRGGWQKKVAKCFKMINVYNSISPSSSSSYTSSPRPPSSSGSTPRTAIQVPWNPVSLRSCTVNKVPG